MWLGVEFVSFINAKEHLKKYELENKIMEFQTSSATVEEAAKVVGCDEERIAKTLSFLVEEKPILIVTSGVLRTGNHKFKDTFHVKAKMIPYELVEELIGHKVGGVCPFGVKEDVTVYLDVSLKPFDVVYPACGSSNSAVS